MIPPAFRAAIAQESPVACPDRCGPVPVIPDEIRERPRICHALGDCRLYLHPDSDEAVAFAESVYEAICRRAYRYQEMITDPGGADMPVHAWGGA